MSSTTTVVTKLQMLSNVGLSNVVLSEILINAVRSEKNIGLGVVNIA